MTSKRKKSALFNFALHLHPPRIPASSARFTYTFGLGGLAALSFFITLFTGLLLLFVYSPHPETANKSLHYIATVLPFGWYVRNLHYWAAQVMVVSVLLHMLRIVLTGGYLQGRRFNWLIGILLLLLTLLMDFSGFPLRWDQESHRALVVAVHLLKVIPFVGDSIFSLIVGGAEVSGATLLRLYSWHIFALPVVAFFFTSYHFWRIRKDGGISAASSKSNDFVTRDRHIVTEIKYFMIVSILLMLLSVAVDPYLGVSAEEPMTLETVNAPWIFLWIQYLLRYLSPFLAGIFIPALILAFWGLLPYMEKQQQAIGRWAPQARRPYWLAFLLSFVILFALSIFEWRL